MARYYFDVHDGLRFTRDDVGAECPDRDAIKREVMETLPAIARYEFRPNEDLYEIVIIVRDEKNTKVLSAILNITTMWMSGSAQHVATALGLEEDLLVTELRDR